MALWALLSLGACSGELSQLIIVVDSDIPVPSELDSVRILVMGPNAMEQRVDQPIGPGGATLPITLGLTPSGDSLGPVTVTAIGQLGGAEIVRQTRSTRLLRGQTRMLRLFLSRNCIGIGCDASQTCDDGSCEGVVIPSEELEPWPGQPPDGTDAGAPVDMCGDDGDCDDDVDCTNDSCVDGACVYEPDHGACDDDDECTDDVCGETGCASTPNTAPCDDGLFCNGEDACSDGSCSDHAGDPCPGLCDEGAGTCGCMADGDCPAPSSTEWMCGGFDDVCDQTGTETRTNTTNACVSGVCEETDTPETRDCTRMTDGMPCPGDLTCMGGICGTGRTITAQTGGDDRANAARFTITCRSTGATCTVEGNRTAACGGPCECSIVCPEGDTVDVCCSNGSICGGTMATPESSIHIHSFSTTGLASDTCPTGQSSAPRMCTGVVGMMDATLVCNLDLD